MPSAAVFSSDIVKVKEHSLYPAGGLAACRMDDSCAWLIAPGSQRRPGYHRVGCE